QTVVKILGGIRRQDGLDAQLHHLARHGLARPQQQHAGKAPQRQTRRPHGTPPSLSSPTQITVALLAGSFQRKTVAALDSDSICAWSLATRANCSKFLETRSGDR